MKNSKLFYSTRSFKIFATFVPAGVLLGLAVLGLFLWNSAFSAKILLIALAVSWLWLFTALMLIYFHIKNLFIGDYKNMVDYTQAIAQGKFPTPLVVDAQKGMLYRELVLAINQIRDQLRANSAINATLVQLDKAQEQNHLYELTISIMNNVMQDLRRPLNVIAGYTYLMQGKNENTQCFTEVNEAIRFAISRGERLVDVKKLTAATQAPQDYEIVNTGEFFSNIFEFLEKSLKYRSVTLNIRYANNLPKFLELNQENAEQLIITVSRILGLEVKQGHTLDVVISRNESNIIYNISDCNPRENMLSLAETYSNYVEDHNTFNFDRDLEITTLGLFFIDAIAPVLNAQLDVSAGEKSGTDLTLTLLDVVHQDTFAGGVTTHFSNSNQLDMSENILPKLDKERPRITIVDYDKNLCNIVKAMRPNADVNLVNGLCHLEDKDCENIDLFIFTIITNRNTPLNLERECIQMLQEEGTPVVAILNYPTPSLERELIEHEVVVFTYPIDYEKLATIIA